MKYVLDCKNWSIEESSNTKKRTFYRDKKEISGLRRYQGECVLEKCFDKTG